jgi:hypothetical protein
MRSTMDTRLPQKVPKQTTCQTPRKWVISDYPLLNCIIARKCEILYSITTKMTCIIRKLTKTEYKTFKQFFDPSNSLWVKAMLHGAIFLATCNAILLLRDVNQWNQWRIFDMLRKHQRSVMKTRIWQFYISQE